MDATNGKSNSFMVLILGSFQRSFNTVNANILLMNAIKATSLKHRNFLSIMKAFFSLFSDPIRNLSQCLRKVAFSSRGVSYHQTFSLNYKNSINKKSIISPISPVGGSHSLVFLLLVVSLIKHSD